MLCAKGIYVHECAICLIQDLWQENTQGTAQPVCECLDLSRLGVRLK